MQIIPTTIEQVMDWIDGGYELKRPTAILVRTLPGKDAFPEIVKYEWAQAQPAAPDFIPHQPSTSYQGSAL